MSNKSMVSIYQLNDGFRELRFLPFRFLQAAGLFIDRMNYHCVYTEQLMPEMTLEAIYERFNIDIPEDFQGHSLSVSDIIVLQQNGEDTAYYVDSFGFVKLNKF